MTKVNPNNGIETKSDKICPVGHIQIILTYFNEFYDWNFSI